MSDIFGFNVNKKLAWIGGLVIAGIVMVMLLFSQLFYYNEAGYITHIQTKWPTEEKVVSDLGYTYLGFGTATPWPREMTIQSVSNMAALPKGASTDIDGQGSALIPSFPTTFLGGVTATVDSNVRVAIPSGEQFIQLARIYRTPENFVVQAIMPVMKSVIKSTAQLMTADDYYSGSVSAFAQAFYDQMADGSYLVERTETQVEIKEAAKTAILQDGTDQGQYGGNTKTIVKVNKVLGKDGLPIRMERQFAKLGVTVVDANILSVDPNQQFKDRMIAVQKSQADLSIARQGRLTAEEQKQLVTAVGAKEVEQKRQDTLRDQIESTTQAETKKQLALIDAGREREKAEVEKATSQIKYEQAQIDAKTTKEKAEAEAYAKKVVMQADGALTQKLNAWVESQKVWASAARHAPVPQLIMGGSSEGAGRQSEIQTIAGLVGVKAAKDLMLDLNVKQ